MKKNILVDGVAQTVEMTAEEIAEVAAWISGYHGKNKAMCDGKGAAWTSEEQAAARKRLNIESGGSSYYLPEPYAWNQYLTDEDKAFLSDYVAYYHQNNKPKPVNIYFVDDTTSGFPYASLVIKIDFRNPSSSYYYLNFYYYDRTNNENSFTDVTAIFDLNYAYQNQQIIYYNAKDWYWVDKTTDYSVNVTEATSRIRIVGYYNYDSNNIVSYEISTSHGNKFYEEANTKYYVVGFDTSSTITMYWFNQDGYNFELRSAATDATLMNSPTFTLLGYYYWG